MRLLVLNLRLGQKDQALAVTALLLPTCERKTTNTLHSNKIQTRIQTITTETMKATLILLAVTGLVYGSHQARTLQVCDFHLPAGHCNPTAYNNHQADNVDIERAANYPLGWTCYKCTGASLREGTTSSIIRRHTYVAPDGSIKFCGMFSLDHHQGTNVFITDYGRNINTIIETDASEYALIFDRERRPIQQGWMLEDAGRPT